MLVGREYESDRLRSLLDSDKSEFVAVYGRRRVGKTYLIRETFNYHFAFQHSGLSGGNMQQQIDEFRNSMMLSGWKEKKRPENWYDAFHQLAELLAASKDDKKVVFIDEMPWMDTPRSNFISALEHFWNGWASARKDIILIVCGSATSWIMDKVILDHGGLHNRLTNRIFLQPFTLRECEQMANLQGIVLSRKELLEIYMIMGGIPYYWSYLQRGMSMAQNIDRLFFNPKGELYLEFDALYASLFKNSQLHIAVVAALAGCKRGLSREEILTATSLTDNGKFDKALRDLEYCGFIRKYNMIDKKSKGALYQLMDNYTLFYYHFIRNNEHNDQHFWSNSQGKPIHLSWTGLGFERVCMQHVDQIKAALGVSGVLTNVYSWRTVKTDEHPGVQIDLLIDRSDNVINLCEAKFSADYYTFVQEDEADLLLRQSVFRLVTKTKKSIHPLLITTHGLTPNRYSGIIQNVVTVDDLFK